MSTAKRETRHTVAEWAQRLLEVAGRAPDRARQQADKWERGMPQWMADDLESVEGFIRRMSTFGEFLDHAGSQELARAKAHRHTLRRQMQEMTRPGQERAKQWREAAARLESAFRKAQRQEDERAQLRLLVEALEPLQAALTPTDQKTLRGAAAELAQALAMAQRPIAPETTPAVGEIDTSDEPAETAMAAYLPPAAELEFDADDERVIERLALNQFDPPDDYRLNLAAAHLSLVSGFEVLLCLPLLRGVEQYPFQINTARQVLRTMRGRALLCDEVGLGKTVEAGLVLKEYLARGLARKVLVLVPPALVSQWREEMRDKFAIDFLTHEDAEFRAYGAAAWEKCDRVIASLHTAKNPAHSAAIHALAYDMIIVDEAHHLKNRATLNWKFVNDLKSKYILLLTATPAQNNLDELFNLITLLSPGQLKTPAAFRREFVARGDPRQPKNRTKLRQLLMDVMVRNTRSQVSLALPPRHAATVRLPLSAVERALYDAATEFVRHSYRGRGAERFIAQTLQAEAGSSAPALRATLENMRRRDRERERHSGERHADSERRQRLDALCDLAAGVTDSSTDSSKAGALLELLHRHPGKVLVFTQFRETQRFLLNVLAGAGVAVASFSGEMSAADKDAQVAAFARDRQVLVSTDVGSEGRNLQFCQTLVNYDLPWNPMKIEQRVGRLHRIGQTAAVNIVNFAAHDTVEDYILEVLDSKINMFELVVGEVGEILGNLDEEREFEDIVLDLWVGAESDAAARQAFAELGEQLVEARGRYQQSKAYDDALFGEDFVAEE